MQYIVPLIIQILLIAANALFAAAEIAVISVNPLKLEKLAEDGNKKAKKLLRLTKNSSKFLSTIQVAITFAALLGSAFAADSFAEPLSAWFNSLPFMVSAGFVIPEGVFVILVTIILSFFSIVFGELVPKRIAMKHAEKVAFGLSGLLRFVSVAFAPFVWILTKTTNLILRMFRIKPNEEEEAASEEELRLMLDTSSERGEIDTLENEMIQNIFEFDDISISEVCTHRKKVSFLNSDDTLEDWKKIIAKTRHGYYPICGETVDDIVAILNTKKFFRFECKNIAMTMRLATEKPYFVPENMKADVLFNNMKANKNYFAVVVDEYGGISGVITIHDLLELLVGDMDDKEDDVVVEIERLDENEWRILGVTAIEDIEESLDIEISEDDCDTFGGYILSLLGEIPDDGASFELETDTLSIKIESVIDHRIESTVVTKKFKNDGDRDKDKDKIEDKDAIEEKENNL